MNTLRARICNTYLVVLAILIVVVYPLAAVPLRQFSLEYDISLPGGLLLALWALPVLLLSPWAPPRWMRWTIAAYLLALIVASLTGGLHLDAVDMAAFILVPWAVACCVKELRATQLTWCIAALGLLWLTQVITGYLSIYQQREVIGIAGNRNWMAALLIATAPWAMAALLKLLGDRLARRTWCRVAAVLIIVLLTAMPLYAASSRAAGVAIILLGIWALWVAYSWRIRLLLVLFLLLAVITSTLIFAHQLVDAMKVDIRLPVLGRSMALITDYDIVAATVVAGATASAEPFRDRRGISGTGPGHFRRAFTPYRASSTYGKRLVAAATTIHPHNELVNIAAQIGVIGAIAWLLLLWPALSGPVWPDQLLGLARISTVLLVAHAMFDMTLVQPPLNYLAWAMIGICWASCFVPRAPHDAPSVRWWRAPKAIGAFCLLLVIVGTLLAAHDLAFDVTTRRAAIEKRLGRHDAALAAYQRAHRLRPRSISVLYQLGSLQLEHQARYDLAVDTLQHVRELDPDYAHVHSLLAYTYLMQGDLRQALPHARRECELYPFSTTVWQKYFSYLAVANQLRALPSVLERLDQLYLDKTLLRLSPQELSTRVTAWQAALRSGHEDIAIRTAEELSQGLQANFLDPLFQLVVGERRWPAEFLYDSFNVADFAYWQQLAKAADLIGELPPANEPSNDLETLVRTFAERLDLQPEIEHFPYLTQMWEQRVASPLAAYAALAFVVRQRGWWMEIARDQDGAPVAGIAYGYQKIYRVDLTSGSLVEILPEEVAGIGVIRQSFFHLQEFFIKNRVLGLLVRHADPAWPTHFDHYPLVLLWFHRTALNAMQPPPFQVLSLYVVPDQIHYFSSRLQPPE